MYAQNFPKDTLRMKSLMILYQVNKEDTQQTEESKWHCMLQKIFLII
jgi:hypothetical protein